jgi:hypothetical protein
VYYPDTDKRHICVSCTSCCRNSFSMSMVATPWIYPIHLQFSIASWIVLLLVIFFGTMLSINGTISWTLWPKIQRSFQHRELDPSPISVMTAMEKKGSKQGLICRGTNVHEFSVSVFLSQSHLTLSALPKVLRSVILSPPPPQFLWPSYCRPCNKAMTTPCLLPPSP